MQREVYAMVGGVAIACLVPLEEGCVRGECIRVRVVAEGLLGPAQPCLECAQVRERQVHGVLDGGGRGQGDEGCVRFSGAIVNRQKRGAGLFVWGVQFSAG